MSLKPTSFIRSEYRADIDGLRAIAVLSVVAFHAFPETFKGGFIGVDVFFVISGFLITSIIFENLEMGTFSFKEFYLRRIKRIFPALIVVLVSCFVFGWFALLPDEFKQLGKHIAGSTGFVQNLILWSESGYFDNAAETKPLLHIWSLGVEEQFYFIWPFLIWITWKSKLNIVRIILGTALISFVFNILWVEVDYVSAFYSPQTRFWELLSGGLLAWVKIYRVGTNQKSELRVDIFSRLINKIPLQFKSPFMNNILSFGGVILLCSGFQVIDKVLKFPGYWAVIPVLATVLIIYSGPRSWFNRKILSHQLAVWIGLISFPLYLWHWPILSFLRIIQGHTSNLSIQILAVFFSFIFAWLTYIVIERPIRFGEFHRLKLVSLLLIMTSIGLLGYKDYIEDGFEFRFSKSKLVQNSYNKKNKRYEEALKNCQQFFPQWQKVTDSPCLMQLKKHNSIAIIGDSHADQLFEGMSKFLAPKNKGVAVFSASCAAPFIGVASGLKSSLNIRKGAFKLIGSAYDYILNDPDIKTVIMAHYPGCSYQDAVDVTNPENTNYEDVLKAGMRRTFSKVLESGKEVIVLLDNPTSIFDPKQCRWRPLRLTKMMDCSFPRRFLDENKAFKTYKFLLAEVSKEYPQIKTFDLSDLLCDKKKCHLIKNDHILYRDANHLNNYGSDFVAPNLLAVMENSFLK